MTEPTAAESRIADLEQRLDRLKLTQRNSASIYDVRNIASKVRVDVRELRAEVERARELFGRITRSPREKGSAQRVLDQIMAEATAFLEGEKS